MLSRLHAHDYHICRPHVPMWTGQSWVSQSGFMRGPYREVQILMQHDTYIPMCSVLSCSSTSQTWSGSEVSNFIDLCDVFFSPPTYNFLCCSHAARHTVDDICMGITDVHTAQLAWYQGLLPCQKRLIACM